jgi:hypothetical protein
MAKNSITDYSKTASLNTDIQSVDIDEGCLPSGINNAIREIMADLAAVNDGTVSLTSPSFAAATITGDLTVDTNTLYVDSTNNRVGIGTSSPSKSLHVYHPTTNKPALIESGDAFSLLEFKDSSTTNIPAIGADGNNIIIQTGSLGSERMRIDSSGNVGINQSALGGGAKLEVNGDIGIARTAGGYTFRETYGGAERAGINSNASNELLFNTGAATERMRIDSSGNVSIGTTSTSAVLEVAKDADPSIRLNDIGNWAVDLHNYGSIGAFAIDNGGTERMRIDSSGNVLVGTTSNRPDENNDTGMALYANGKKYAYSTTDFGVFNTNSTGKKFYFRINSAEKGSISFNTNSVSYTTTSDYRLKENVIGITDGIERVKQLDPKRFNFIGDSTIVDGFIAHEAATVVPEAVTGEKDAVDADGNPEYQGIDQAKLVPLLTAALQEAITKIEDLEARVATLEGN